MRRSNLARLLPSTLACALLSPALANAQPADGVLALDNAYIIEAEYDRVSARSCVRVQDARIAAAGDPACLHGARTVDLQGRYLMPGLIDMHAHLTLGPLEIKRERGRAVMQALPDEDIAEHNARHLVAFGVTTVRNPGGDLPAAARYDARLAAGELVGPEAFNAGPVINNADLAGLSTAVRSAEDMDEVVRAQVEAGADWIKLYTGLSPELLKAGIDAAHRHGRPTVAHKDDARRYAHPRLLAHWDDWFTFAIGWQPDDFERARAVWPKVQRMAARLYATDARMTLGTDMSNPWIAPGISLHREMQLLADAGVPNARLLLAATRNAADALGVGERLGRIAPGFDADVLVLDANPLGDIQHTRAIHAVVVNGALLTTDALNQLKGE